MRKLFCIFNILAIITSKLHIVTILSDSRPGFGLDIGFIDHFNTQLVITLDYSAIANFYTLQITRTHTKYFPPAVSSLVVAW
jgi:ethanolamine utilization microcompartment shell protein EutS